MFNSKDPCLGENLNNNSKVKPTAVVVPLPRPSLSLGFRPENQRDQIHGSLPTSPESDCDEAPGVNFFLDEDTRKIMAEFFSPKKPCSEYNKVLQTMRRVVDNLLVKHELVYKGMLAKLNLEERGDDLHVIRSVAEELFSDGVTNWGRIASLLAFGTAICLYEKEHGCGHRASLVGDEISSYLLSEQRAWLQKNKAWNGFVEFFHVRDPESAVKTALVAFVTVAGIGAVIAHLTR